MKRLLFYIFLLLQIVLLVILTGIFENFNDQGDVITIKTKIPDYYMYDDGIVKRTLYTEYEISNIDADKWNNENEIDYNNRVYVLLEENEEGIFEVVAGSDEPLKKEEHQVLVTAKYNYFDETRGFHSVRYEIEEIEEIEKYGSFRYDDQLLVTVLIGKWGQRQILNVEKVER